MESEEGSVSCECFTIIEAGVSCFWGIKVTKTLEVNVPGIYVLRYRYANYRNQPEMVTSTSTPGSKFKLV